MSQARVVRQERGLYALLDGDKELSAYLGGNLQRAREQPVVGDQVLYLQASQGGARIVQILPRRSALWRRRPGSARESQLLAVNIDLALIVLGLDRPIRLGFVERAVRMARSGGVEPVLVLNKLDLCPDSRERALEIERQMPELTVLTLSARDGEGCPALIRLLAAGVSVATVGPSGAGKSSLVNRILGQPLMRTGEVRAGDHKGMHTTTHRQLLRLPGGAFWIDGPGIRELGLPGEDPPPKSNKKSHKRYTGSPRNRP